MLRPLRTPRNWAPLISRRFASSVLSPESKLRELAEQLPDMRPPSEELDELDWSHLKDEGSFGTPESDLFSSGESGRTKQKEEMIFTEVLNHVLSGPSWPQPASKKQPASKQGNSTPLADSILALFDKQGADSETKRKPSRSSGIDSLMDGLLRPQAEHTLGAEELKKREAVSAHLSLVFEHIESLKTNKDIISYYETTVIPRFDASQKLDFTKNPDPCSPDSVFVGSETAALILEKCIEVLAEEFKDPIGALHVFEQSKHHSIEFFSVACLAEVYNSIIRIRWYDYRDLYAVVNLAAEIAINAIPPTLATTELLSDIYRDAFDSSKGIGVTSHGMPLWTGQEARRLEELNRYRMRFQSAWAAKPISLF